jgi:hypothetical protein
MSCNGNVYNIGMGCCEPVLGPVENYYTKPTIDRMLEEKIPTSNTAFTNDAGYLTEHQHIKTINGLSLIGDGNIEIGTGGTIDLSNYYTTAQTDSLIESAVTRVEGEIPTIPTSNTAFTNDAGYLTEHQSLSGYATQQWVRDQHYITGVDLSDYALKSEIPTVPTSNTAFTNDAGYLTEHQSLSGYATEAFVSAFTYDKATIDEKVAGGGSFDPSQYYNKTATDALLDEKLDVTAYTPTDLSNYYTKTEVDNEIISAITDVEAEIPTVPTSNTAFTNDAGYLTEHQSLSGYATEQWVEDKHYITGVDLSDYALKSEIPTVPTSNTAFTNDAGYITGVDLSNYATTGDVNNVSTALTAHTSNTTIHVTPEQVANWNAKSDFSGSYNDLTDKPTIPTVPTDISAFNNDVGYITGVDLSNYATKDNLTAATDDMATKTWVNNQGYLTEHQSLTAYSTTQEVNTMINQSVSGKQDTLSAGTNITIVDNVISAQGGGATYTAGTGIDITNNVISSVIKFWCGTMSEYEQITQHDNNTIYLIHS